MKSFGLKPLYDCIALSVQGEPSRSLAFYLRKLHHSAGKLHSVEEQAHTTTEIASHGALPVVYLLVHKENKWMAEQIADDVHTALVYTNPLLTKMHLYRDGASYVTVGDQKREAQVRAEAALAALTLQVAARTYTVVPPPYPQHHHPHLRTMEEDGGQIATDGVQPGLELGMKRTATCRPSMIHLQDGAQPPGDTPMTLMRHQRP